MKVKAVFFLLLFLISLPHLYLINKKKIFNDEDVYHQVYVTYRSFNNIKSFIEKPSFKELFDAHTNYPQKYSLLSSDPKMIQSLILAPIIKIYYNNPNIVFTLGILVIELCIASVAFIVGYFLFRRSLFFAFFCSMLIVSNPFRILEYPRWEGLFYAGIIFWIFLCCKMVVKFRFRYILGLSVCLGIYIYASIYLTVLFLPAICVLIAIQIFTVPVVKLLKGWALSAAIGLLFLIPIFLFFFESHKTVNSIPWAWSVEQKNICSLPRDDAQIISNYRKLFLSSKNYLNAYERIREPIQINPFVHIGYVILLFLLSGFYIIASISRKNKKSRRLPLFILLCLFFYGLTNMHCIYDNYIIRIFPFSYFRNYFRTIYIFIPFLCISATYGLYAFNNKCIEKKSCVLLKYLLLLYSVFLYFFSLHIYEKKYSTHFFLKTREAQDIVTDFLSKQKNKIIVALPMGFNYDIYYLDEFIFFNNNFLLNISGQVYSLEYFKREIIANTFPSERYSGSDKLKIIIDTTDKRLYQLL